MKISVKYDRKILEQNVVQFNLDYSAPAPEIAFMV